MRSYWTAEEVLQHYYRHHYGIQAGAILLILCGVFFLPLTAGIFAQMRHIPKVPTAVPALQLAAGAGGLFTFMMPGIILAATNFRLDRPIDITQALNDLFWLSAMMPWQLLILQSLTVAYAIIIDIRRTPLYPKSMAYINIIASITYILPVAVHCFATGPMAWHGIIGFWIPSVAFILQILADSLCLARAAYLESDIMEKPDSDL
jgi:hypothetical protein